MKSRITRSAGRLVLLACGALLLAGCLLTPGRFTSELDLRRGGDFAYRYEGQIYLLALSKLAEMGSTMDRANEEFIAQPCYQDEEFEERECSAEELAEQRLAWEEARASRAEKNERDAEMMRAMLGGIDPADPDAAEELARKLRRQKGWEKVEYLGDGLFEVSFAISGRLGHDFLFPTMEGFPMSNTFVQVAIREGGAVRVDAPGFAAQDAANPFQGMMGTMAGMASAMAIAEEGRGEDEVPFMPELDGSFRIVTDGEILANNTDEGPASSDRGQALEWLITKRTTDAPTALINLAP